MALPVDNIVAEVLATLNAVRYGATSQALAASTVTLTATSTRVQIFTGGTTGQIVKLPDATTLGVGWVFQVVNQGTQKVTVQDNSGAVVIAVPAKHEAIFVLTLATTAAGAWMDDTDGLADYHYLSSTTAQSFTSTTDTTVTGLSVTPEAGVWILSASLDMTIATNSATGNWSAYAGGVQVADSVRRHTAARANQLLTAALLTKITVDGATQVDVRASCTSGSLTFAARSIVLERVDA